jgi:baculoviral IAP repeat-containing protein 6
MTTLILEIDKWNAKKDNKIMNIIIKDNVIDFTIDDLKIKLHQPKNDDDFYVVESPYSWTNELNIYSMTNKPTFLKIMLKLMKLYESSKKNVESNNDFIEAIPVLNDNMDTEYELYKMKHFLEECMKTSINPLNNTTSKTNQIFDNKIIGSIIIEEYMSLYKKSKQNNKFEISLNDNNIYDWKIIYKNFSNTELNKSLKDIFTQYGYNGIIMNIKFHATLYPNFPPTVSIIRPKLANSLMHKISNMKMISLSYWSPARSIDFIVNKIYNVLNKYAIMIDSDMNDMIKYPNGSFLQIEHYLMQLASYIDSTKDELDDETYININDISKLQVKHIKKDVHWKSGTGYGHHNAPEWDIKAYIKSQEEKDKQIEHILEQILNELYNITKENALTIYNTINDSYLISYMKNQLLGITMLEINKHINIYKLIFTILHNFANEDAIFLFGIQSKQITSLYGVFNELYKTVENIHKINKDESDEISNMIMMIYEMVNPIYQEYMKKIIKENDTEITEIIEITKLDNYKIESEEDIYKTILEPLKFDEAPIVGTNYYFQKKFDTDKGHPVKYTKRIVQEYTTLMQAIPIHYKASIFVRIDPNNICAMRFLMTGPENTPYECGCFIFDMYVGIKFPQGSPEVYYLNTGNKRFNPNLYADGKVCLSILGTWSGSVSEQWNEKTSSFFQILMSIQSQILIEEPYFNEPGHESYENNRALKASNDYNQNIRLYTMKHAIYDLIKNPQIYSQFTDVIKQHFKIRKEKVLEVCYKWTKDASATLKKDYEQTYQQIIEEINKL